MFCEPEASPQIRPAQSRMTSNAPPNKILPLPLPGVEQPEAALMDERSLDHPPNSVHAKAAGLEGVPLAPNIRTDMESAFNQDLSQVRVHADPAADAITRGADAAAMTIGNDVWFGAGRYRNDSLGGRLIIAHELAHVVQQQKGGLDPPINPHASHEREASLAAITTALGERPQIRSNTGVGIARITPEEETTLIEAAKRQIAKVPLKQQEHRVGSGGAATEGSYMGRLANEGVPAANLDEFTTAANFPHMDIVSSRGLAQVKLSGSLRMFLAQVDPETLSKGGGLAKATRAAEKLAENAPALKAAGVWPKTDTGEPVEATVEALLENMSKKSLHIVGSDRVEPLRNEVRADAEAIPETWGLKAGPELNKDIEQLVGRIQSAGLTREQLLTLERNHRLGIDTKSFKEASSGPAVENESISAGDIPSPTPTPTPGTPAPTPTADTPAPTPTTDTPALEPVADTAPSGAIAELGKTGGVLKKVGSHGMKWGGRALAAYSAWTETKRLRESGHSTSESIVGGVGLGSGFLAAPALLKNAKGAGAADLVINLANAGLNLAGAPREVTDVSSTVASATPSSFAGSLYSQGARAYKNLGTAVTTGDARGIDRQVEEMAKGDAGAPLQGYAMMTQVAAELGSGKGLSTAIMKVGSKGQDSAAARIGNKAGDETYKFINKDLPEATEFAKKDIGKIAESVDSNIEAAKQVVAAKVEAARAKGTEIKDDVVNAAGEKLEQAKALARKYLPF
jgi:Domain of unknown function (DUF4157)